MTDKILAAMLALPLAHYPTGLDPETAEQRTARFEVVAAAVETVSREATCTTLDPVEGCTPWWPAAQRDELAAMLVTLAWWESKFVLRVHAGQCRNDECDALKLSGGGVIHRARSLWQVQRNPRLVSRTEWVTLLGTSQEATTTAARVAARVLAGGRGRCAKGQERGWEAPAVASYATGSSCSWSKAPRRVAVYRRVLTGLR